MKKHFNLFLLFFCSIIYAQDFEEIPSAQGILYGEAKFLKNSDAEKKLLVVGYNSDYINFGGLYNFQNDEYSLSEYSVEPLGYASIQTINLNNDEEEDFITTGVDNNYNEVIYTYTNNQDETYTKNLLPFSGVSTGNLAVGDLNNDGYDDFIIAGLKEYDNICKLYLNDGTGEFTEKQVPFFGNTYGDISIFDANGNGFLDVLITGYSTAYEPETKLYLNDGEATFTENQEAGLEQVYFSSSDTADYDNDEDLDILISGYNSFYIPFTAVYKNDGSGIFTVDNSIILPQLYFGSANFVDYNLDGLTDIFLTGTDANNILYAHLYTNENGDFIENSISNEIFTGVYTGSSSWGDFDNDGDLDLVINGLDNDLDAVTKIYKNLILSNENSYCEPVFNFPDSAVEPISLVQFNTIEHLSSAEVSTEIGHYENFSDISTVVTKGETYTLTVQGNTNGENTNYITIFIDWNQDGEFSNSLSNNEKYQYTDPLINSDGGDEEAMSYDITIPEEALLGDTRLRIIKNYQSPAPSPCDSAGTFGQAEDYTLIVEEEVTEECPLLTELYENFDSYSCCDMGVVPNCWDSIILGGASQIISNTEPASGTSQIYQFGYGTDKISIVVLPQFSNINSGTHQFRFKVKASSESGGIEFGYITDITDASTFEVIETLTIINNDYNSIDAERILTVPTTVPGTSRLAIRNPGNTWAGIYWDDVYWEPISVISVDVTTQNNAPAEITSEDETLQLFATITPEDSSQEVTWSITSGNEFAIIDENGLITAITNGTVTVRATSLEDETVFGELEVTINIETSDDCLPEFEYNSDGNMITRVIFNTIDNESPFTSGTTLEYEDFTEISTDVEVNQDYEISVKGPSSTFPSDVMVFIDFNQNNDFDDEGESFYVGRLAVANPANANTISQTIQIPENALMGQTKMRIVKNTNMEAYSDETAPNSINNACDATLRSGQTEDYSLNIIENTEVCEGTLPDENAGDTGCVSFMYNGETVEYTTVRTADGSIWLQQNLGSHQIASSAIDQDAYGDLFQWGRWDDGHQKRDSEISTSAPIPNNPSGLVTGSPYFYVTNPEWWQTENENDTWEASTPGEANATNGCDPCKALGEQWRLPTPEEWQAVIDAEEISDVSSAFDSNLKLTVAGARGTDGVYNNGERGYYWTKSISQDNPSFAKYLYYSNYIVNPTAGGFKEQGSSIRCIYEILNESICDLPSTLSVESIEESSVSLTWIEDENSEDITQYNWILVEEGQSPSNPENYIQQGSIEVGNSNLTLNELDFGDYQFYIYPDCTQPQNAVNVSFTIEDLSTINKELEDLKIYPNPVKNQFYLNSQNSVIISVEIYDLNGRLVFKSNKLLNNKAYNISSLSNGLYLLKVSTKESIKTYKILKE